MKKLTYMAIAFGMGLGVVSLAETARATPDVTYTVSGTPGDYVYDFAVTNNQPNPYELYSFFPFLADGTPVGAPANWVPSPATSVQWCNFSCFDNVSIIPGILPGDTLGGFVATSTDLVEHISLTYSLAYDNADDYFDSFPVEGTASASASVPEPTSIGVLGSGLFGFCLLRRRRKSTETMMAELG